MNEGKETPRFPRETDKIIERRRLADNQADKTRAFYPGFYKASLWRQLFDKKKLQKELEEKGIDVTHQDALNENEKRKGST